MAADRAYYVRHSERIRARNRRYQGEHRVAVLQRQREYRREQLAELKAELFAAYGSQCACCGERRPAFLTLDHIHGDGAEHRRRLVGGSKVYRDVRRLGFPTDRFRLLCMNCNFATRGGTPCVHEAEIEAMAQAQGLDTHRLTDITPHRLRRPALM